MSLNSILLIEDDKINALTFKRGLERVNSSCKLTVLDTAEKALIYLREQQSFPNLIVLDISLPKMNGLDFLKIIKNDADLKQIPVVVLTTSINPQHKKACFDLQVTGYFLKPLDYFELINSICRYWEKSEFSKYFNAVV